MTAPTPAGCPWPISVQPCDNDEWETFDNVTQEYALALASATLYRLCAYRVGGCPKTLRPCQNGSCGPVAATSFGHFDAFTPVNWNGTWSNRAVCACSGPCRHDPEHSVQLPGPVWGIVEVKVDGVVVPDTEYWLTDGFLIGLGSRTWPTTQNLDLPDSEVGTWSITYNDTAPVDLMGARACGRLAIEYGRAACGGACIIPESVTSLVRQGVTYDIPAGSFPNGETGMREVDAFIALWNPSHRKTRGRVWVPS
jgi:hypothetical protein